MSAPQYGDFIVHTDIEDEGILRQLIAEQMTATERELGRLFSPPQLSFNAPYTGLDPVTGEFIHAFASTWKATLV